jgi:hypothetical protein
MNKIILRQFYELKTVLKRYNFNLIDQMKKLILKNKVLSILILLVLSVSLNSCGDDNSIKSFLEKYGDTDWKFSEPTIGETLYVRILNDSSNPFDIWFSVAEAGCFIHESLGDGGTVEVLENTENGFKIKVVDDGNPSEYAIFTFTVTADILTIKSEFFEDDILDDQQLFVLQSTTDDLDGLNICPEPAKFKIKMLNANAN